MDNYEIAIKESMGKVQHGVLIPHEQFMELLPEMVGLEGAMVYSMWYGLGAGGRKYTKKEIAERCEITQARVGQMIGQVKRVLQTDEHRRKFSTR